MNGLRFRVGEMAVFVFGMSAWARQFDGCQVEILDVGTRRRETMFGPEVADYRVRHYDDRCGLAQDYQLRKIDPPAEPASLTRDNDCEVTA